MHIHFEPLGTSVSDMESLRELRNECKESFMNTAEISYNDQVRWYYERYLKTENDYIFSIRETPSRELLGFISLYEVNHLSRIATMGRLMIDPKHRGKNIAKQAIELIHQFAKILGIESVRAEVKFSNVPARNLYSSLGYEVKGFTSESQIMRRYL